jgi:hypothetical protein
VDGRSRQTGENVPHLKFERSQVNRVRAEVSVEFEGDVDVLLVNVIKMSRFHFVVVDFSICSPPHH